MDTPTRWLFVPLVLLAGAASAQSNIDPAASFAWSENAGWLDLRANCLDGVRVSNTNLTGFAWGENFGWVNFGDGTNLNPNGFGVLNNGAGQLSGYAWSENAGWINFDTSASGGSFVLVGVQGFWTGYAWSENVGWIRFDTGFGVRTLQPGEGEGEGATCPPFVPEGQPEGTPSGEGAPGGEGTPEGSAAGEGQPDGVLEGEPVISVVVDAANTLLQFFASLDTDQNGALSYGEVFSVLQAALAKGFDPELILFHEIDKNTSNSLTVGELRRVASIPYLQAADTDGNRSITLDEVLRVIQLYNSDGFTCAQFGGSTEDGYLPGGGGNTGCVLHTADYLAPPWQIDLSELLRVIQHYRLFLYSYCGSSSEDGYCAA